MSAKAHLPLGVAKKYIQVASCHQDIKRGHREAVGRNDCLALEMNLERSKIFKITEKGPKLNKMIFRVSPPSYFWIVFHDYDFGAMWDSVKRQQRTQLQARSPGQSSDDTRMVLEPWAQIPYEACNY